MWSSKQGLGPLGIFRQLYSCCHFENDGPLSGALPITDSDLFVHTAECPYCVLGIKTIEVHNNRDSDLLERSQVKRCKLNMKTKSKQSEIPGPVREQVSIQSFM